MKKVEARKKVHLYIHANDADRLRIVVFSHLWYIFVYTVRGREYGFKISNRPDCLTYSLVRICQYFKKSQKITKNT